MISIKFHRILSRGNLSCWNAWQKKNEKEKGKIFKLDIIIAIMNFLIEAIFEEEEVKKILSRSNYIFTELRMELESNSRTIIWEIENISKDLIKLHNCKNPITSEEFRIRSTSNITKWSVSARKISCKLR